MYFHEFGDSCAQNKTSEISNNELSGIIALLCAEQTVGNPNENHFREFWARNKQSELSKIHFREFWGSCAQDNPSEISKIALSGFWDSCAQNKTSEISRKMHVQEFWDSCAQKKTSGIQKNGLSGILGLLCAEQSVGNLKHWTFKNSGTPVCRT